MKNPKLSSIIKTSTNDTQKNKGGRPLKELTEDQKHAAVQYVRDSGLWKIRLATFLRVDFKTLARILKEDKAFHLELKAADSIFFGNMVSRAKPEFILRTKYKDEFPDLKIETGHDTNEELERFLDNQRYLINARKRESEGKHTQE